MVKIYIMTLGVLAAYRGHGIGNHTCTIIDRLLAIDATVLYASSFRIETGVGDSEVRRISGRGGRNLPSRSDHQRRRAQVLQEVRV